MCDLTDHTRAFRKHGLNSDTRRNCRWNVDQIISRAIPTGEHEIGWEYCCVWDCDRYTMAYRPWRDISGYIRCRPRLIPRIEIVLKVMKIHRYAIWCCGVPRMSVMQTLMNHRRPDAPPDTNIRSNHKIQHFETLVMYDQLAKLGSLAPITTSGLLLANTEI